MKFDTALIDMNNIAFVTQENGKLFLEITPIKYSDDRNPRLPRKYSKQTNLQVDTNHVFLHAFQNITSILSPVDRFSVDIKVFKSNDRLGGGDLDNYCKAILDAITNTKKVWVDDEQVDEIKVKRFYTTDTTQSYILLTITKL